MGANALLYNTSIGRQTLHDIGVVLDFKEKTIIIDSILLSMRNIVNLQLKLKPSITRVLQQNTCLAQEPVSTYNATKRVVEILYAKYDTVVRNNCSHLEPSHQEKVLSLLLEYELLFNCTLGNWNWPPISIELKEGAKPYHGRSYPIPQIHEATLIKELNKLVSIGVLKRQSSLQWASPTYIILKKDIIARVISDFRELNKWIVRQPIQFPKSVPQPRS
jgi:hypothetical protein